MAGSGDNLIPSRGFVPSEFRELFFIKFTCRGIYFKSLVGLLLFICVLLSSTVEGVFVLIHSSRR